MINLINTSSLPPHIGESTNLVVQENPFNREGYYNNLSYYKGILLGNMFISVDGVKLDFNLTPDLAAQLFSNYEIISSFFPGFVLKSDPEVAHRKITGEIIYYSDLNQRLVCHLSISQNESGEAVGFIAFNPNRLLNNDSANREIKSFLKKCAAWKLTQCDVAIDIPIDFENFAWTKSKKNMHLICASAISRTVCWGTRNSIGSSKLYNKSRKNKLLGHLTRLELTLGNPDDSSWNKDLKNAIPPVYLRPVPNTQEYANLSGIKKAVVTLGATVLRYDPNGAIIQAALNGIKNPDQRKCLRDMIFTGYTPLEINKEAVKKIVETIIQDLRN